jgi:hypothetical protein
MPTPFESSQLNLKLFDMRREPELRAARAWFILEFHPETADEFFAALMSDRNSWMRMVMGYWDMAASMVTHDAIDRDMFLAAHTEILGAYAKVQPFIAAFRARQGSHVLAHVERVVMSMPDADEQLAARRNRLKALWVARRAAQDNPTK